jgi:XTP/dITP diphosphohydrolase
MTEPLVSVTRFRDLPAALMAKAKLESAGIGCALYNAEMIRLDWPISNLLGGIDLRVPAANLPDARAILAEPVPESIDEAESGVAFLQPRCPECGSVDVRHESLDKAVSYSSFMLLGIPIPVGVDYYQCERCGHKWTPAPNPVDLRNESTGASDLTLYVASSNRGKLQEFSEIAEAHGIDVEPVPNLDLLPEPKETGATFEQNARIKGVAYSQDVPGKLVIADDSGLEVDALHGAPGVYSARYAAKHERDKPSDSDNNYKLLGELADLPNTPHTARFVCVIALAKDGEIIQTFRGEAKGEILASPLGRNGFGYDPLFFVVEANKTFAEMNAEEKALYSHRGAAFRKLMDYLTRE